MTRKEYLRGKKIYNMIKKRERAEYIKIDPRNVEARKNCIRHMKEAEETINSIKEIYNCYFEDFTEIIL